MRNKYEKEKENRLKEKKKQMEELIAENPHVVIDEEAFLSNNICLILFKQLILNFKLIILI